MDDKAHYFKSLSDIVWVINLKPELYTSSDSDIKKLLSSIHGTDLEIAVYLGAFCAMSLGEICALESSDINGNIITISKSLALCEDGNYKIKSPKTLSSYRTVQSPDFVIQRLSGIKGRIVNKKPYNVTKALKRALKANGLPNFRFHDLRHPYVKPTTKKFITFFEAFRAAI